MLACLQMHHTDYMHVNVLLAGQKLQENELRTLHLHAVLQIAIWRFRQRSHQVPNACAAARI